MSVTEPMPTSNGIPIVSSEWTDSFGASICLEPTAYSRIHSHTFFEIEFAISGSVNHFINNKTSVFQSGDIWFVGPSTVHHFYGSEQHPGIERFLLYFDPTLISNAVWKVTDVHALPFCLHLDGDEKRLLLHMFRMLLSHSDNKKLPRTNIVKWTLEWLILHLFDKYISSGSVPQATSQIQPALVYIQTHFRDNLSVADVAATIHFSAAHFSRLFHKTFGLSYRDYVLNLRLSYAYCLLFNPIFKVHEVCLQSGFHSPEYFSRAFKKKFGISPEQHYLNVHHEKRNKTH